MPFRILLFLVLFPLFSGAQTAQERYDAAIADALNPTPEEISTKLIALAPGTPDLVWKQIDGKYHVLVITWKSNASWYPEGPLNTGDRDTWVTAVPELKNVCSKKKWSKEEGLVTRLEEALGLPLNSGNKYFIELWVKPEDIFRPCPDADIKDWSCGLNWPENTKPEHRLWFNQQIAERYVTCAEPSITPYPFTQLGYTYDWSASSEDHIGFSEFVIRKNSDVIVKSSHETAEYCNQ